MNRFGLPFLIMAVLACGAACNRKAPEIPLIQTEGLDPAIRKLIESTTNEVRAAPREGSAWGKLGSVLMHYEYAEEAGFAFDQAETLSPRDARWPYLHGLLLMDQRPQAAIAKMKLAIDRDGGEMPRLRLAQFFLEHGHADNAQPLLQEILAAHTNHALARLELARTHQQAGQLKEALQSVTPGLKDPHTRKAAHALLAVIHRGLGEASAADEAARQSAALPPDLPWPDPYWQEAAVYRVGRKALIEEANGLINEGRLAESLELLIQVTRDYPADDEAWYLLGWAFNQQKRPGEAEAALGEHLKRSPASPKGHAQLAVALLAQSRYDEAIEILRSAIKIKPTWRELHSNMGFAFVQLGRYDEAIDAFRRALACDSNHVPTYTALADLLSRRGDGKEAQRLVNQALVLDPLDARARALRERLMMTKP